MRDSRSHALVEFLGDLDLGPESDLLGDMAAIQSGTASRPVMGKVEVAIDQHAASRADVGEKDADLAVLFLSEMVAPLAFHADGMSALLGEAAAVKAEDPVGIAEITGDLAVEFLADASVVPLALPTESLETLSRLVVGDRDGLDRLTMQVAGQPLQIHPRQARLFFAVEEGREGTGERFESVTQPLGLGGIDLRGVEQFLRNGGNAQRHKSPSLASPEGVSAGLSENLSENAGQ